MSPDVDTASLLLSVFFGALGAGYALYGRKQRAISPLVSGVALMVFPFFVHGTLPTLLVGVAIAAVPYFWRA
ncbi:hypothetical protein [Hydrogenophaga sp. MI9]|uniref:hypothetical protein n=1 Tax=Hydrogenophaga sp. MI9 TaxID=3453719 RepID=UPI003EEB2DC1